MSKNVVKGFVCYQHRIRIFIIKKKERDHRVKNLHASRDKSSSISTLRWSWVLPPAIREKFLLD